MVKLSISLLMSHSKLCLYKIKEFKGLPEQRKANSFCIASPTNCTFSL